VGAQRKRKRREEELEEQEERGEQPREREQEKEVATEATPADKVLELQKTAGNRAVGAALARWGLPWIPQAAAPEWPKEAEVILDGEVIPLSSFSWTGSNSTGGAGASGVDKPQFVNEVNVTTAAGEHSAELFQKAVHGDPIKTAIIVMPGKDGKGFTITLTDVLISSYQTNGPTDSWSMSFAKREFSQSPPPAQPKKP
jgi:Type VI secretion system effector, Hcp